jgi:hypothetical protein
VNAYGVCLAGRMKGTRLKPLILEPEFWFAWSEFPPEDQYVSFESCPLALDHDFARRNLSARSRRCVFW